MPEQTLYDELGVTPDATREEIDAAHRRQLKFWHPDRNKRTNADERAKSINRAYDVLSDAAQRADYDRSIESGGPPPPDGVSGTGFPPWTPPPGRYRRKTSSRTGAAGASPSSPPPPAPGPGASWTWPGYPPAAPPPPTARPGDTWAVGPDPRWAPSAGTGGSAAAASRFFLRQSRVAMGWLVQPLRQPALTPGFTGAMTVRVIALAATAWLLWLAVPVVVATVWNVVLLALTALLVVVVVVLLVLFSALGSAGSGRRRRRRRRR